MSCNRSRSPVNDPTWLRKPSEYRSYTMRISTTRTAVVFAICLLTIVTQGSARELETLRPGEKLTLERAIELTIRNHPRGLEMKSEAGAASERVGEARAALLPQVYSAAEYLRSTDNPIGNTTYLNPEFIPPLPGTPS